MPSVVAAQPEKPIHYTYLKSFRTEQCKDFLQHRCKQHRPYTCFNWHFPNQRRRRPIRKRDGSFNYSANTYCANYDENTGLCPDGESCAFLHRNVGDTERHYHLRYYKTEQCAFTVNSSGHCSKNGPHCMFAHGPDDCRKPVYSISETELGYASGYVGDKSGDQLYDKEDKTVVLDAVWNDPQYVAAHYKTEQCSKWVPSQSGRLCRQGRMCPYYHSSKDRRRSLATVKYRSSACPMVKNKDEWGDPEDCDKGDNCPYCHSRMELQYHPDVYKSLKCDSLSKNGQCVKGIFCAFSHADEKIGSQESLSEERNVKANDSLNKLASSSPAIQMWNTSTSDSGHGLSEITLPVGKVKGSVHFDDIKSLDALKQLSTSDLPKSPSPSEFSISTCVGGYSNFSEPVNGFALAPGAELSSGKGLSNGYGDSALFGTSMNRQQPMPRGMWLQPELSGLKIGDTAPAGFLPPHHMLPPQLRGQMMVDSVDRMRRQHVLMQQASHIRSPLSNIAMSKMEDPAKLSSAHAMNGLDNLDYEFDRDPHKHILSIDANSPSRSFSSSEFSPSSSGIIGQIPTTNGHGLLESPDDVKLGIDSSLFFPPAFDHSSNLQQMVVKMRIDLDLAQRRLDIVNEEKRQLIMERDKAIEKMSINKEDDPTCGDGRYLRCLHPLNNLNDLSVPLLQQIELQLKNDLHRIKAIILDKASGKCLNCLDKNASIRLPVCHHKVLCEVCYMKTNECPTCQAAITLPL